MLGSGHPNGASMLSEPVFQVVVQKMPEVIQLHGCARVLRWLGENSIGLIAGLASIGGAVGAIWAARTAKATVNELKKEKEEERNRAKPRISIGDITCDEEELEIIPPDGKTQKTYKYKITIINERKSKLSELYYSIILVYNGKQNILNPGKFEPMELLGENIKSIDTSVYVDDPGFNPEEIGCAFAFFRVIDVFGYETDLVKRISHNVSEREAIEKGLILKKFTSGAWTHGDMLHYDFGGYIIENIDKQMIHAIINELKKYPGKMQEFVYSFEVIKSEFKWFKNWKEIGKN